MMRSPPRAAQWLALLVPAALLGGAYISQYGFDLYPCEMCWWQRYPHFAAVPLAVLGFVMPPRGLWVALAAIAILASGLIGAFHAGVEYGWWDGPAACTGTAMTLDDIMAAMPVPCDQPQWTLAGISLAGFNFLISTAAALAIFTLLAKGSRHG